MEQLVKTRLRVENDGERVTVSFTRGAAPPLLRFPPDGDMEAAHDLSVLIDNLEQLIDAANLEIEAAILRQEEAASE